MPSFHVTIHNCGAPQSLGRKLVEVAGRRLQVLDFDGPPDFAAFPCSFEEATERLDHLPRCFVEPDGSFVWTEGPRWQLDGNLYDRDDRLWFVDLKGNVEDFQPIKQLLDQLLGSERHAIFQLMQEALYVGEPELRRWLGFER